MTTPEKQQDNHLEGGPVMIDREVEMVQENAARMLRFREVGPEQYFKGLENPEQLFAGQQQKRLCCIDEGVCEGSHIAGSGILMNADQIDSLIKEQGIEEIESHEGCGAAALQAKNEGRDNVESFAQDWAKDVAQRNGIKYAGHRALANMHRPSSMHNAEICYYDGTGMFNRVPGSQLPAGFTVTRRLDNSLAKDAALAAAIASGPHGLNDKLTAERPFMFVILGDPSDPRYNYEALKLEIESILQDNPERALITGFDVDPSWLNTSAEVAA